MRNYFACLCLSLLLVSLFCLSQQLPAKAPTEFGKPSNPPPKSQLEAEFQARVEAEWNAIKAKDKKVYGDLLADDYEGVEVDSKGERNKLQAINELAEGNISRYTLWGFKLIPLGPDANFVIYEVTMQFPPKSEVRFSRVYITELWLKRAGEWKIVHYQETHVK
ncbi:MAG TPA: nuclear transport factor 2 family protein [Terriglobales bacterium]|nr:nuclear transport factor 2 family protein [Terriglobales bacterium]